MQAMIKGYEDVTENWRRTATPNSHSVLDASYVRKNGTKYYVDGKNVALDYSAYEKEVALWLEDTLGGEIYMLPKVNSPEGIRTPDYLFRGECWDLKEIYSSGKRVVDNRINGTRKQTNNYILDISKNILSDIEIIKQVIEIYNSKNRSWVDKVIIKRENTLIKVFIRKRD